MPLLPLLLILGFGILIYMSLWFVFGMLYLKRLDSVDVAWGLGFVYVAWLTFFITGDFGVLQIAALGFVSLWGLRLSIHIARRNIKKNEDARYTIFREKWGKNSALLAYIRIFLLQGALILAISSPLIAIITADEYSPYFAVIGFVVWAGGILFEAAADFQLNRFLKARKDKGSIMKKGLWRFSRHPNYFGEITAWTGASIVACSTGSFWGLVGPIILAFLIIKISGIPPIEKRYQNNSEYQKYKQQTSSLVPLPSKG